MSAKWTLEEKRNEFKNVFCKDHDDNVPNPLQNLKKKALEGYFHQTANPAGTLRSLAWKIFLGVIPGNVHYNEWMKHLDAKRNEYQALLEKYEVDPHKYKELDPAINNPLSEDDQSPWKQFFQNAEMQREINQDIERCYPEVEFFAVKENREAMLRILFIYAKQTPKVSYRQGMHELLAVLLYVVEHEKLEPSSELLDSLLSARYVEHDLYAMFCSLMERAMDWYLLPTPAANQPGTPKKNDPFSNSRNSPDEPQNAVVNKCKYIQGVLLREKDPELHAHLTSLDIQPQLYMLRWIRLLVGREFHLDDLMVIWDGLLAFDDDLTFIDYICIALLLFVRSDLLHFDATGCMRRLFKSPPIADTYEFVERALKIKEPGFRVARTVMAVQVHPPHSAHSAPARNPNRASMQQYASPQYNASLQSHREKSQSLSPAKLTSAATAVATIKSLVAEEENPLLEEVQYLRNIQLHQATRLDRLIYSIQNDVLQYTSGAANDALLVSIAELKQIRDILTGSLSMKPNSANTFLVPKEKEEKKTKAPVRRYVEEEPKEAFDPLGAVVIDKKN